MAKDSNIVHHYFRKKLPDVTILVRVNPILYHATEIRISVDGKIQMSEVDSDEGMTADLTANGFEAASALEFNLYLAGLAS